MKNMKSDTAIKQPFFIFIPPLLIALH
jgi:hypothetical protein